MNALPVVVIGSGLAGYAVTRELRRLDPQVPIVVLSRDGAEQYAKPNLSAALGAGHTPEQLVQAPAESVAQKLQVEVRPHTHVTRIDTLAQVVHTDAGEVPYRDLVLALGADPLRPPFLTPEVQASGRVLQVNDLTGYRLWRERLQGAQSVLVIGAGLIGVEFASDLRAGGHRVQVVDLAPHPLGRLLPPELGALLRERLALTGVTWHLGQGIDRVQPQPEQVDVHLADGRPLHADLVLVAIGLTPRIQLANDAGLTVSRAIQVDAHLQTSAPHVYALGDCAEVAGQWLPFVAPLLHAARALAATLAGKPTAVVYPAMPVVVKTPAWPTIVLPPPPELSVTWRVQQDELGATARAEDAAQKLRGFVLMGQGLLAKAGLLREMA